MISLYLIGVGIIYFIIAVFMSFWLTSRVNKRLYQILVFIFSISTFILIPTWDILPGRFYFKKLCDMEGGIKIYKKLKLASEYWDNDGNIKKNALSNLIKTESKVNDEANNIFRIRKTTKKIIDKNTDEVLGSYTYFIYFGGWLLNNSGIQVTGVVCPTIQQSSYKNLLEKVFTQN